MPETLIETSHLIKRYGDKVAVNDVSLEVYGGEVFGFLGPNGAGKTTTIKMIVGLLQPTAGTVKVAGYDVQAQPMLSKASSGYVPDTPAQFTPSSPKAVTRAAICPTAGVSDGSPFTRWVIRFCSPSGT